VFDLGVPVLGICYGMQTMAAQLGGSVAPAAEREYGYAQVRARGHSRCCATSKTTPARRATACSTSG
jgi:GMP synthase-like glutamine amidotransferase